MAGLGKVVGLEAEGSWAPQAAAGWMVEVHGAVRAFVELMMGKAAGWSSWGATSLAAAAPEVAAPEVAA